MTNRADPRSYDVDRNRFVSFAGRLEHYLSALDQIKAIRRFALSENELARFERGLHRTIREQPNVMFVDSHQKRMGCDCLF